MSAVDTFRDALFGNPPSATIKPSREGALAAFTELYEAAVIAQAAAQAGITIVADTAARDTFYATEANRTKLVYVNNNNGSATDPANGVYEYVGGAPRIAQSFYEGLATVVQPLLDDALSQLRYTIVPDLSALEGIPPSNRQDGAVVRVTRADDGKPRNFVFTKDSANFSAQGFFSGQLRDNEIRRQSTIYRYSGPATAIPLLTMGRRNILGFKYRTMEPLWLGQRWPVPQDGPVREAVQSVYDYTGGSQVIPLLTMGRRVVLGLSADTMEPLWMGEKWASSGAQSEVQALDPKDRPPVLSSTSWRSFIAFGQSLSVGDEAHGVISTTQPYANLMPVGGIKTDTGGLGSFVPLIEEMKAAGGTASTTSGETIVSSGANHAVTLAIKSGMVAAPGSFVQIGGAPGLGGQTIQQLSKGTYHYNKMLAQVQAAFDHAADQGKAYTVDFVCWIQGEQDAEIGTSRADYLAALLQLQADIDADMKAITGQSNTVRILLYQTSHRITPSSGAIALAQMDAVKQSPFFHFVTPVWTFPRFDYVHLTAAGYNRMGKHFGRAAYQLVGEARVPDCLRPLSAFIDAGGTTLRVKFRVPKAPLVLDTVSLGNPKDYGVRVKDDAGTLTLSNIAVSGDTLTATIDRPLGANPKFRIGLDYPGTDNGRATHNFRDSTADTAVIQGNPVPLWHVSAADELDIITLEA